MAEGDCGTIITDKTPFYATSGGQTADTGVIKTDNAEFEVQDTIKLLGGKIGHVGKVTKGMFAVDETVKMCIDVEKRLASGKNHSATHLLQKALREVLGTHVEQHGSDVNPERLRFDFSHFSAMTTEEIAKVEKIVNEKIQEGLPVVTEIMDIEDAKKTGAGICLARSTVLKSVLLRWVITQQSFVVVHMLKIQLQLQHSRFYLNQVLQQECVV